MTCRRSCSVIGAGALGLVLPLILSSCGSNGKPANAAIRVEVTDSATVPLAAKNCPILRARGLPTISNSGFDTAKHLLPGTHPTAGIYCSYPGVNALPVGTDRAPVSGRKVTLTAAESADLAARVLAISTHHGSASGCPPDDGSFALIGLIYNDFVVGLLYSTSGCRSLTNGSKTVDELANPSFYNGFRSAVDKYASS